MKLKKSLEVTWQGFEEHTTRQSGNILKTLSVGSIGQGTRKGTAVLSKRSHVTVVHYSVPLDCIERVTSENGEKT